MDRRNFFSLCKAASCSYLVLRVTGCGPTAGGSHATHLFGTDANAVLVYDLVMEGWSTLGSGYLGDNGILPASQIVDFKTVTLDYIQDDHGHKFSLQPSDFAKLLRGQPVSVLTTVALDHNHEVRIDPAKHAPGSQAVSVRLAADGTPVAPGTGTPTTPIGTPVTPGDSTSPQLYGTLNEAPQPNLYVASTADLDESSVQFCLDTSEHCAADPTLWQAMQRHTLRQDKQIFVSSNVLNLGAPQRRLVPLIVRGKTKLGGRLVNFFLALVNPAGSGIVY